MHYLFSTEGATRLQHALSDSPLLAFDFDGTLAPIVPLPNDAKVPLSISATMQRLCEIAPVAILTGRSIVDVEERLGFKPRYIVGNHGAEGMPGAVLGDLETVVTGWIEQLPGLVESLPEGVAIEKKRFSLSLHYRLTRNRPQALAAIRALVAQLTPTPELIGGKCVLNLVAPGSPNKYAALYSLLKHEERTSALFIGDDETDEAVFRHARPSWLTIRVEYSAHSAASFYIGHQSEMAMLLQTIECQWRRNMRGTSCTL